MIGKILKSFVVLVRLPHMTKCMVRQDTWVARASLRHKGVDIFAVGAATNRSDPPVHSDVDEHAEQEAAKRNDAFLEGVFLILTTYNNEAHRQAKYETVIQWWLTNTRAALVLVDSTGKGFPRFQENPRVSIAAYDQAAEATARGIRMDPTTAEKLQLTIALEKVEQLRSARLLIRINGKYIIPSFISSLREAPIEADVLLQNQACEYRAPSHWECSEVYAMKPSVLIKFLATIPTEGANSNTAGAHCICEDDGAFCINGRPECVMESFLWAFTTRQGRSLRIHRLPSMLIPEQYRTPRADGSVISHTSEIEKEKL